MADPKRPSDSDESCIRFSSDCDILEITEENTEPGKVSERYRKALEQKYGRKAPPANGTPEGPHGS